MSIFVDTGIFVGFVNKKDRDHSRAAQLVDELRKGKYGIPYTSDYVFDEAVTVALVRTRRIGPGVNAGRLILGSKDPSIPAITRLVRVDEQTFLEAWRNYQAGRKPRMSFTDYTSLSLARSYAGGMIMSFDDGFDGLLTRVH
jgi:predicted nucleic acid-binding protein